MVAGQLCQPVALCQPKLRRLGRKKMTHDSHWFKLVPSTQGHREHRSKRVKIKSLCPVSCYIYYVVLEHASLIEIGVEVFLLEHYLEKTVINQVQNGIDAGYQRGTERNVDVLHDCELSHA